jgi:hypothetical protein
MLKFDEIRSCCLRPCCCGGPCRQQHTVGLNKFNELTKLGAAVAGVLAATYSTCSIFQTLATVLMLTSMLLLLLLVVAGVPAVRASLLLVESMMLFLTLLLQAPCCFTDVLAFCWRFR